MLGSAALHPTYNSLLIVNYSLLIIDCASPNLQFIINC
ncbi:hypothetical protein SPLC1_S260370 [Arthrospira platensis C1]|nr:hypothetical protein SPLC1_S260370 [Arthrospira platensis C1]